MGKGSQKPGIKDHLAYWTYRLLESLLRLLPIEIVWVIGYLLGTIAYLTMRQRRHNVIRNLRIAFGKSKSFAEITSMARRNFQHTGANLICSFKSTTMHQAELRARVQINHEHRIDPARKNGGILLLAHMGNWELLSQLPQIMESPPPFGTLYRPLDNPLIDNLVRKRREQQGVKTFSRRDGFFKPISHLKEGGFLGTIADQHAGKHGMAIPFFGKLTSITNLPALLHRRSGTSIVPMAMCTTGIGKWKLEVLPLVNLPVEQRKDTYSATITTTLLYEKIIQESPHDVLWMHSYWRIGQRRPLVVDGLQKKDFAKSITQPFQVLIFTGSQNEDCTETTDQLQRLQSYRPDISIITAGKYSIHPSAQDHISFDPDEPPHILSNAIRAYDRELDAPIDCGLDFTEDGHGGKILARAGLMRVFCRHGKWMGKNTQKEFKKHGSNDIALMLTSLGVNGEAPSN